jgi:hypothetical protein
MRTHARSPQLTKLQQPASSIQHLAQAKGLHFLLVFAFGSNLCLVGVPRALSLVLACQNPSIVASADVPDTKQDTSGIFSGVACSVACAVPGAICPNGREHPHKSTFRAQRKGFARWRAARSRAGLPNLTECLRETPIGPDGRSTRVASNALTSQGDGTDSQGNLYGSPLAGVVRYPARFWP